MTLTAFDRRVARLLASLDTMPRAQQIVVALGLPLNAGTIARVLTSLRRLDRWLTDHQPLYRKDDPCHPQRLRP